MTNAKPGYDASLADPKPGYRTVEVRLPTEMDEGLSAVVRTFGIAKAEIIRHAIVEYLQDKEVVPPSFTYEADPAPSRGRLRDQ